MSLKHNDNLKVMQHEGRDLAVQVQHLTTCTIRTVCAPRNTCTTHTVRAPKTTISALYYALTQMVLLSPNEIEWWLSFIVLGPISLVQSLCVTFDSYKTHGQGILSLPSDIGERTCGSLFFSLSPCTKGTAEY